MTTRATYPNRAHVVDTGAHALAWIVAVLGLVAAAIGGYIAGAPDDGSVTVISRTWSTGEIVDAWAPGLMIAGGAFAAIGMAVSMIVGRDLLVSRWMVAGEALLGAIGVAAMLAGFALLT